MQQHIITITAVNVEAGIDSCYYRRPIRPKESRLHGHLFCEYY